MFGLGFGEIIIIAIIAILFLGPDKLPSAMVDIAKFFRQVKKTIGTVKDSLEEEMHVSEIKEEALAYKKELLKASGDLKRTTDMTALGDHLTNLNDDIVGDIEVPKAPTLPQTAPQEEKITFAKKAKEEKTNV
jgi:sec-independent protein translocase protein TatB